MKILISIIGLLIGAYVGAESGAALGAILGALVALAVPRLFELQDKITRLERTVARLAQHEALDKDTPFPAHADLPDWLQHPEQTEPERQPAETVPVAAAREVPGGADAGFRKEATPVSPAGLVTRIFNFVRAWLTTGNVPVKLGVIVSFFGVAFLLKYAVDQQLLLLPIELRLAGVAAFALVLLAVGWRLRERLPVYALSLQGGGVGVLYLTIFAAMRLYDLLPAGPAFTLLVLLTGCAGVLAILQESRALAVLGTVGGFLAPVLVSTGSGDHVMLFSYYLVLNAAVLGIAWFRAWRELNIIGFVFTFIVGGTWGYLNYRPDLFASTEPFLLAYFFFYQAVAVLFALRRKPDLKGVVDGTLVFGTPVVGFALQARLVADIEYGLAISAAVVAVLYAATALTLIRTRSARLRLLAEAFIALGVAFATIAIPLALDARWTAAAWAMEGAALVWVAVRQDRGLARLAGSVLLIGSGTAFAHYGWQQGAGIPVLNGNYLGGMLIGLASLFSSYCLGRRKDGPAVFFRHTGRILFFWGIAWCLGSGVMEIGDRVSSSYRAIFFVPYLGVFAAALLAVGQRFDWSAARGAVLAYLPALLLPAMVIAVDGGHPFGQFGWAIWPLAFGIQYFILWILRDRFRWQTGVLHTLTLLVVTAFTMWEIAWQIDRLQVSHVWTWSAASLVPGLAFFGVRALGERLVWPVAHHAAACLGVACGVLIGVQLFIIGGMSLLSNGDATPLRYVPLLNPLDIATGFALIVALRWLQAVRKMESWLTAQRLRLGMAAVAGAALATSTAALVRAIHHIGGVPWDFDVLFQSVFVQSSLSIYWGILGFSGMVRGARARQRTVWLAGAGLMAVVVIKLFLVDLGNTGTVERIVSFIGTGGLLLIVGYFAPVPPRQGSSSEARQEDA